MNTHNTVIADNLLHLLNRKQQIPKDVHDLETLQRCSCRVGAHVLWLPDVGFAEAAKEIGAAQQFQLNLVVVGVVMIVSRLGACANQLTDQY